VLDMIFLERKKEKENLSQQRLESFSPILLMKRKTKKMLGHLINC